MTRFLLAARFGLVLTGGFQTLGRIACNACVACGFSVCITGVLCRVCLRVCSRAAVRRCFQSRRLAFCQATCVILYCQPTVASRCCGLRAATRFALVGQPSAIIRGSRSGLMCSLKKRWHLLVYSTIGVWRAVEVPEPHQLELLTWDKLWGSGAKDPATFNKLAQEDVDLGSATWLPGRLDAARSNARRG